MTKLPAIGLSVAPVKREKPLALLVCSGAAESGVGDEALQAAGFIAHTSPSPADAMGLFETLAPDVVVVEAGDKQALAVCSAIRLLPAGIGTPILVATSLDDVESATEAYDSGATDVIGTPINPVVLSYRLKRLLRARRVEEKIRNLAYYDGLTGLPNPALFWDLLGQALSHKAHSRVAVILLDVDHLKGVNDSLGRQAGDALLREVAARLQACLRRSDYVARQLDTSHAVARQGGDEFIIMLTDSGDEEDLATVCLRILDSMTQPFTLGSQEVFATASIGVSVSPADGTEVETLVQRAETALYSAKRGGGNTFKLYTEGMNNALVKRFDIERNLRQALKRDELVLFYQPQMNTRTREWVGIEALIRWRHPENGLLGPNEFISVAEDSGLIVSIGYWVLRTACRQIVAWHNAGAGRLRIAVNISCRQLRDPGFVERVSAILAESGLEPKLLELELTESSVMETDSRTLTALHALKAMGVRLAVDDFGTGYSALSYLREFPVDMIKIDKSFIGQITSPSKDSAITSAMIAMAHQLSLSVVAEGVETAEQLNFLDEQGCDKVQGYLFGRPFPAEEFPRTSLTTTAASVPSAAEG